MMSLAIAMPSTSSSARSAPKMRSALSALLAQSGGSSCVSVLMMRRFWSAAVVRREALQSQSATMMTNARTSAVALNAPRPAHLARKIGCRFTSGERLCAGESPSARGYAEGRADHHDLRGVCQGNRCGRESAEYIDDLRTPRAFSRPLASRARSRAPSSALGSQRTLRWRERDSNLYGAFPVKLVRAPYGANFLFAIAVRKPLPAGDARSGLVYLES